MDTDHEWKSVLIGVHLWLLFFSVRHGIDDHVHAEPVRR
jgi:hypothetical protein